MPEEPCLRGPNPGVNPLLAPLLYSFEHAREDLARWTEGLTTEQIWARPHGFGSVGFQLRHIAGSVERLTTALQGRQLSPEQFAAKAKEMEPGASREELLRELEESLARSAEIVRAIDPATLADARTVGRLRLPTTVIGLLTHIAEHTMRHVGEAISAAKLARVELGSGVEPRS
jgi:uncharacterized damage-inducible protein DinB